ncbi:MAG: N-acetyltransferase family protein [Saprospiraceae bacterium]
MKKIQVRPAHLEELPTLLEFEQGIVIAERPYDPTLDVDPISYYDIKAFINSENAEVVVAIVDDEIVASAYAKIVKAKPYFKYSHYAYLGFMFVKPEFRGKGINGEIIRNLNLWAKSKNITEIQLQVYDENNSAIKAYEKAGFKKYMVTMRMEIE